MSLKINSGYHCGARKKLYLAAVANQDPSDEELAQMVHNFCNSILCAKTSPDNVFGPVEFAFYLFIRQRDGRYQPINHLTTFFAAMQWCL